MERNGGREMSGKFACVSVVYNIAVTNGKRAAEEEK
jgi:hypothetical protein